MTKMINLLLPSARLTSIDFTRGLVIVIMALDHIRDLLHTTSLSHDPLDFTTTSPALFLTRWITHFCAPVFVFLAGTSAYLMMKNQNDTSKTRRFLFTRGLWLIFLEISIVCFGIFADIQFRTFLFQVIFAIGSGFVIVSFVLKVPSKVLGLAGIAIIALHDVLPVNPFDEQSVGKFVYALMFDRGFFKLGETRALMIGYALVPWLGIMLTGFGFGRVFEFDIVRRKKVLFFSGLILLVSFILLRSFNIYGDHRPWSLKQSELFSVLSFLDVSKYPPSLLYTAMTLSVMFIILWLADNKRSRFIDFFVIYGRVPMFFYVLHWYIVHISMFVMLVVQGIHWQQMPFGIMSFGRPESGVGLELPFVYLYWICLIFCMYPLCKWFGKYKAANREKKWLSYL